MTKTVLGLAGYARSGKDTVADLLITDGFTRIAFADTLREALYRLDPAVQAFDTDTFLPVREVVDAVGWEGAKIVTPEVRDLLQRLGTEVGRDMFGYNFWVEQTFRRINSSPSEKWVVTDVRFPNEADAVRDAGGFVVRVRRPGFGPVNSHPSETALDSYEFDGYIDNEGTITDLGVKARDLVSHFHSVLSYGGTRV